MTRHHANDTEPVWSPSIDVATAVVDDGSRYPDVLPTGTRLDPVYPNPFNPSTTLRLHTDRPGAVRLAIYDVAGQRVRLLIDGHRPAGTYELAWDGTDEGGLAVATGVYLARLQANGVDRIQKMLFLK